MKNKSLGGRGFGHRGFTFIELAVVLLILAMVSALAFPLIYKMSADDLKSSSRHLIRTIRYLNDRAATTKKLYRLNYQIDRGEYWVTEQTGPGLFAASETVVFRRGALPRSVRFVDVVALNQKTALGEGHTDFYPVGRIDKTLIHLKDKNDRELTLIINPVTGRVKVYEGYWEETDREG
ncbi:MAG TPA: prepilin-type N-terminal cleavage/methylation domain-containing protein [Nitrospiria bacterium]